MTTIKTDKLLAALNNTKKGTIREAFENEEPDFVQEFDKECTGITMWHNKTGFSVDFSPPIFLKAGVGYVFEEDTP